MILVQGWVRLSADDLARLRPVAEAMVRDTRAEAGCLAYAYAEDLFEPGLLHISERWIDIEALAAHFATPHMARFNEALFGAPILAASVKAYSGEEARTLIER